MTFPVHIPDQTDLDPRPPVDLTQFQPDLHDAVDHAHGTDDPVFEPALTPDHHQLLGRPAATVAASGKFWLPAGFHYGLHIVHLPLESAGPFTGGGNKWTWHITVSNFMTVDAMWHVLGAKRAAAHLVVGGRPGLKNPVVIQMIPFDLAGRALEHPSGPETNRADTIQVEICAMPDDVPNFGERMYKTLANIVALTNRTVPSSRRVQNKLARKFTDTDRFGGDEFVRAKGHHGHMHVPKNSHFDPTTKFKGSHLLGLVADTPANGYHI